MPLKSKSRQKTAFTVPGRPVRVVQWRAANVPTIMASAPVLVTPDFKNPFAVQRDASTTEVGGLLFQTDVSGGEHSIAYMSAKFYKVEQNYSKTELECYAAILSITKFRAYVEGMHFKVITDHASLKWLMGQKDLPVKLARWSLKLHTGKDH